MPDGFAHQNVDTESTTSFGLGIQSGVEEIPNPNAPLMSPRRNGKQTSHNKHASIDSTTTRYSSTSQLKRKRGSLLLSTLIDTILVLLAAAFVVFGFSVLYYRQARVSEHAKMASLLQDAAKLGPTIFPILFASILGRSLHIFMLLLLERGSQLGVLNLLAGSTSVAGAIFSQASLRIPSVLGATLLVAWALSPLGGQASLRVVSIGQSTANSTVAARYMAIDKNFSPYETADLGAMQTILNGLFNAALLGPAQTKDSPTDTWTNVKIPLIEEITKDTALVANSTWIDVPSRNVTYSSLVGLPLNATVPGKKTVFSLETSYWTLECPKLLTNTTLEVNPPWFGITPSTTTTSSSMSMGSYSSSNNSFACRGTPDDLSLPPRYLIWNGWDPSMEDLSVAAECSIRTTYVEVQVQCAASTCAAIRMRNSTQPHPSRNWTFLDGPGGYDCNWYIYFLQIFLRSVTVARGATGTVFEGYLPSPNTPATIPGNVMFPNLSKELFAIRFAQLMNSFWTICAGPFAVAYGFDTEARDIASSTSWETEYLSKITTTTADATQTFDVIVCHGWWLVALIITSLSLVIAGLAGILVRYKLTTPELILNWTTVIRDSPYVEDQFTSSGLDDSERSRLLRHSKIRFGDVEPASHVGHLAIGTFRGDSTVTRAKRDRTYD